MVDRAQSSTFELKDASTTHVLHDGDVIRHPRSHFLDWVVDGAPLRDSIIGTKALVTPLNRPWLSEVAKSVEALTGRASEAELPAGRVGVFLCAVCGDVDVSAVLGLHESTVTWSDLRWEDATSPLPVEGFPSTLTFERTEYERALARAYARVASFPYEELDHRGRRFLWPWQWGWRLPRL